jgi:VanZ family protein
MDSRDYYSTVERNISRATAWFLLTVIAVLSLVPPSIRPTTFLPHKVEHAGMFLLAGVAFGIAHRGYEWLSSIGAVIFCASVELAQLAVPGRHARLSDFVVDAVAICAGIFVRSMLTWISSAQLLKSGHAE